MIATWTRSIPERLRPPSGTIPLAVLVFLLVVCLGNSTIAAQWVPNSDGLTSLALAAALVMGILALVRRIPWAAALIVGAVLCPLAAYVSAHGALVRAHPEDPGDPLRLLGVWASRIASGDAANDTVFYLYLLSLLFWVVGGWLSWCSLRWRQPLLGLVPGAAAFATNVLNFPSDQNGYVVAFLVLTLGVLLWTSYLRQLESATQRRVRLSSDARWDFWESGVVVMAAVIAIGLVVPPLTSADRTVDIENGSFRGWAELEQRLNHPVAFGSGATSGTSTGFASLARLAGPIQKTSGVVFTYTINGSYGGPRYFRGYNLDSTSATGAGGPSWRYSELGGVSLQIEKDASAPYVETYQQQASGSFKLQMLKPPDKSTDVLFYPGSLLKTDRTAVAHNFRGGQPPSGLVPPERLDTLDRLSVTSRGGGSGNYQVTVQYSTASEDQLRAAGTDYAVWLDPYRNFAGSYRQAADAGSPAAVTGTNYRSKATLQRIQDLARRVTAGKDNPYDQATAIESYLRSNYQYTLQPTEPPAGADPLEYFLFSSKEGYCEYFASAMGDMLRSLGIPTRLVNGYGPGSYDEKLGRYVVKESDAHTWVESYFPGYGWIIFEPTPDGTYFPVPRGNVGAVCATDAEICAAGDASGAGTGEVNPRPDRGDLLAGDQGLGSGGIAGGRAADFPIALIGLLLALVLAWVAAMRYLRPRTVSGVWRRTSLLSRLVGVQSQSGETPHEFGARLAREIPEAATPARALADGFALAAYAPRDLAAGSRTGVLAAWEELRPLLLRRLRGRLRLAS